MAQITTQRARTKYWWFLWTFHKRAIKSKSTKKQTTNTVQLCSCAVNYEKKPFSNLGKTGSGTNVIAFCFFSSRLRFGLPALALTTAGGHRFERCKASAEVGTNLYLYWSKYVLMWNTGSYLKHHNINFVKAQPQDKIQNHITKWKKKKNHLMLVISHCIFLVFLYASSMSCTAW